MGKETRYYSLFEKQDGKWVRISTWEFHLSVATRAFQHQLMAYAMSACPNERRLRVVNHIPDSGIRSY